MGNVDVVQKNDNVFSNGLGLSGGALAAIAAKAAAAALLLRITYESVEFQRDDGRIVDVPIRFIPHPENTAIREYAVVLNGSRVQGLMNAAEIHVSVERVRKLAEIPERVYIKPQYINLYLDGMDGILRLAETNEIGLMAYAAIDKDARNVIFQAVADVVRFADVMPLLMIKVSTVAFNNSPQQNMILGSGGNIVPTSQNEILIEIANSLEDQYDRGIRNIIAVPGNAGHKYVQEAVHISMTHCIRCRNYIGNAIDMAAAIGMENFLLVGNCSKLIRLAAGIMDTHTWTADGRREVLSLHTVLAGGTISQARILQELATTDQMLAKLTEWGIRDAVMNSVCTKIGDYMQNRIGGKPMGFGVVPIHQEYGVLGQTPNMSNVLAAVSREQFALSIKKP
ncbi:cobalt-precorrin-5B (C(1))-methyltransferase [Butyrivibrio sp. WCD3002]|uniref:cobalt-precorrin-5B (C(1))-methyltransferase n=1 Tax=Butyrivibrio sp. WCD3002 TaxID=1280676 RepID=UPI00040EF592|nr:cobalt-precorrin-5B (C(1))-methyltransferase [Butyrivibrio sp. WCD3002]